MKAQRRTLAIGKPLLMCLECGNRFFPRNPDGRHRCGACASSAIVTEEELRRGGLALKSAAYTWLFRETGQLPPSPPPAEVIGFPLNMAALFAVMSKAKTPERRRRAVEVMLIVVGFPEESARSLAAMMYSEG